MSGLASLPAGPSAVGLPYGGTSSSHFIRFPSGPTGGQDANDAGKSLCPLFRYSEPPDDEVYWSLEHLLS